MADPARPPGEGGASGDDAAPASRPLSRPAGPAGGLHGGMALSGFGEVLRIPNFRRLFAGQAISGLGDWVGTFAFIVAAQQLAPDQPVAVGAVLVIRLVPSVFATPIGGVLSDRWNRKSIMIWTDIGRFAITLAVPFVPRLWALYVFAFATEVLSMMFLPARDASLPNIVGHDRLEPANALVMGSSFAGIPLAAPVFAGLAWAGTQYPGWLPFSEEIHRYPFAFPFVFDAFTYLVSAVAIGMLTLAPTDHTEIREEPFWEALGDGARFVARRPFIRGLAAAVSVGMLGGGVLFAVGVGYVKETLGGGDVEFGWLMGIFGAGMVAGFLVSQIKTRGVQWMIRGALVAMGTVLGFMSVVTVLWIGYLLALVFGIAFSVSLIVAMSAVQAAAGDEIRGRVMAAVHMLVRLALSVGAIGGGALAGLWSSIGFAIGPLRPDSNQIALLVSGALIAAGALAVRAPPDDVPAP